MFDQPRDSTALENILGTLSKADAAKTLETAHIAIRLYRFLILAGKQPQEAQDETLQTFEEALHIEDSDPTN